MAESVLVAILQYIFTLLKVLVLIGKSIYDTIFAKEASVENEIVLITGTAHGIGKELALRYANLGAKVVCWDINEENNMETVNLIKSKGLEAFGFTVDVSNRERVFETATRVLAEVGDVTILIQNAGVIVTREMLQHSENEIKKLFDINVLAICWITQAFLPRMIDNDRGHIVGICSVGGIIANRNIVPYCASKFAVRGLMEGISNELYSISNGKSKVKFTTIYPFYVNTNLFDSDLMNIRFKAVTPLLSIQEVAEVTVSAQRKGCTEVSIPGHWIYIDKFMRFLPREGYFMLNNFVNAYIQSDKKVA